MTTIDALANPDLARLKAAEMEIMICDARALAARFRRSVLAYELAGNAAEASSWAVRAEAQATLAQDLDRQRAQLVARYCPPATDDRGVAA